MRNTMPPLADRACTFFRRLAADQSAFSAVLTALALTMLMGFVGLAIDVGMWQWTQRDMQEAADHAAFAAAQSEVTLNPGFGGPGNGCAGGYTICVGTPNDYLTTIQTGFSVAVAGLGLNPASFTSAGPPPQAPTSGQCYSSQLNAQQGYSAAGNIIEICVIYGTATGVENAYAWQVTIAQPRPMWFSKILFSTAGTINVSAIAEPKADNARSCVIANSPTTTATGFLIDGTSGTANVTLTGCDTVVSSSSTTALATLNAANFSSRAVYVGGGESNGGLTFSPGPGAAQNYQNLTALGSPFISLPANTTGGDPYNGLAPPAYSGAPAGTPGGTPSPTGGKLGNGCDYYTGDYIPSGQPTPDGVHANLPPQGTSGAALASYDGPGIYCQYTNGSGPPYPASCSAALQTANNCPTSPANFVPWDGSMLPAGLYVLYGVGMQLPSSSATLTYTCTNSGGDSYSATTGTCNNSQGIAQPDPPWGQCSGGQGGVDATKGVTIYVMPSATTNTAQVQLTPVGGTGTTCFAINAPQKSQIRTWVEPTNFSSNYSINGNHLALQIEGIAIQVAGSMSQSQTDTIGPNASVALNGVFYDPVRTLNVTGVVSPGVTGSTTLVGTGNTVNAGGPTPCSQIDASLVGVVGPANVNLAYCAYPGTTYIQSQDYNYLGSVQLVQ